VALQSKIRNFHGSYVSLILFWCVSILPWLLFICLYFHFSFLLAWPKRNKRSSLYINFTHLYASVKARKTRLDVVEHHPCCTWSWCFAAHMPARFTFDYICCKISIRPILTPWKFTSYAKSMYPNVAKSEILIIWDWPYKVLIVFQGRFLSEGHQQAMQKWARFQSFEMEYCFLANGLRGVAKTWLRKTVKLYRVLIFWSFLIKQKGQEN